jgi:uncharacterized protein (TIGR02646 family)
MRAIAKGAEPPSLTAHRQTAHCDYDNYADKDALRHALVSEQRGICCYCMGRLHNEPGTMKVEHWLCQRRHPAEQLNYRNLLGACLGGQGQPSSLQHCDTRKGDRDLQWNPAEPAHHIETRLRYETDGSIRSDDPVFDVQLEKVLNLNIQFLKNNRKAIWDAITQWWRLERARLRGPVPRTRFQDERDRQGAGNGQLKPYSQVAVWWLDQRLARMSA